MHPHAVSHYHAYADSFNNKLFAGVGVPPPTYDLPFEIERPPAEYITPSVGPCNMFLFRKFGLDDYNIPMEHLKQTEVH